MVLGVAPAEPHPLELFPTLSLPQSPEGTAPHIQEKNLQAQTSLPSIYISVSQGSRTPATQIASVSSLGPASPPSGPRDVPAGLDYCFLAPITSLKMLAPLKQGRTPTQHTAGRRAMSQGPGLSLTHQATPAALGPEAGTRVDRNEHCFNTYCLSSATLGILHTVSHFILTSTFSQRSYTSTFQMGKLRLLAFTQHHKGRKQQGWDLNQIQDQGPCVSTKPRLPTRPAGLATCPAHAPPPAPSPHSPTWEMRVMLAPYTALDYLRSKEAGTVL